MAEKSADLLDSLAAPEIDDGLWINRSGENNPSTLTIKKIASLVSSAKPIWAFADVPLVNGMHDITQAAQAAMDSGQVALLTPPEDGKLFSATSIEVKTGGGLVGWGSENCKIIAVSRVVHSFKRSATVAATNWLLKGFAIVNQNTSARNNGNGLYDAFHMAGPLGGGYPAASPHDTGVDTWGIMDDLRSNFPERYGFYFSGRGEIKIINCVTERARFYGIMFDNTYDLHLYGVVSAATGGSGVCVSNATNIRWYGGKIYATGYKYDDGLSDHNGNQIGGCGIKIDKKDYLGLNHFNDVEIQDTRTSYLEISGRGSRISGFGNFCGVNLWAGLTKITGFPAIHYKDGGAHPGDHTIDFDIAQPESGRSLNEVPFLLKIDPGVGGYIRGNIGAIRKEDGLKPFTTAVDPTGQELSEPPKAIIPQPEEDLQADPPIIPSQTNIEITQHNYSVGDSLLVNGVFMYVRSVVTPNKITLNDKFGNQINTSFLLGFCVKLNFPELEIHSK